jgi:RNA polymerase sigma factor (sigma-70 family)
MRTDDAQTDELHQVYLRARSKDAKALALVSLIEAAAPFIARVVRHFSRGPIGEMDTEDALQEARIGFMEAVERCDPSKGPLRPYAMHRIRHRLQTHSEVSSPIPRRSGMSASVLKSIEVIRVREGREPTREELNGHAKDYDEAFLRPRVVASFDALVTDGVSLAESIGSDAPNALDLLIEREERSSSTHVLDVVESALTRPVILRPKPRKIDMSEPPKTSDLQSLLNGLSSFMKSLDEQEADIKKKRDEFKVGLSKIVGVPANGMNERMNGHLSAGQLPKPILALNQDKLPHRIVAFLKENPSSRVAPIASAVGETSEKTAVAIAKLRDSGIVIAAGKARGTTYSVSVAATQ